MNTPANAASARTQPATELDQLMILYEPLVQSVTRWLRKSNPAVRQIGDIEDVLQEARVALLEALQKHWPTRKSDRRFKEYARGCIRNYLKSVAEHRALLRVPHTVAATAMAKSAGKHVETRCQPHTLQKATARVRQPPRHDWDMRVPDHSQEPANGNNLAAAQLVRSVLQQLPDKDRQLLTELYGLNGSIKWTVPELAARDQITTRAVYKRREKAIERARGSHDGHKYSRETS